ncbi:MAG TPA: winged helix-turn-helix domain-containing protein [Terriglobales bacterium]|nr:winged helix-turn-helix domain-containing protein [Terriglobales bacterium]
MAATPHPRFYRFGTFQLDVPSGELRRNGIKVRLPGQSFQVLLCLLERPGEVVTREELRQLLWPAGTFVDFDEGMNAAVKKLRAALSDSAENPRFVETLPRRGYRFLCPVITVRPEAAASAVAAIPTRSVSRRGMAWWGAVGVLLAVLAVTGITWYRRRTAAAPIRSIAVLPLRNLSNDPEQEYFSEGLTDELITRLASLQGLRVISFTSAMQYKDTREPLPQIAKELNVDAVVEGSVLRSEGRVRITAQLVEAASDRHLWAHSYESEQRDVLALQSEVARDVADNIRLSLDPASRQALASVRPIDPQAHEDYLRGRYFWSRRTATDIRTAIRYFEQAVAIDPNYAPAYADLADCYALLGGYSGLPQGEFMPRARAAALKALELDQQLPEAHTALAVIAQDYDWDWPTTEREYLRAIQLDPNYATGHHWYAEFLAQQGRFDEAFAEIERARQLDPLSLIIATDRAKIFCYARQYDRSVTEYQSVLARDPGFTFAHNVICPSVEKGDYSQALADIDRWRSPGDEQSHFRLLAYVYARSGRRAEAQRALLQLEELGRRKPGDRTNLMLAYTAVGRKDEALAILEQLYRDHSMSLSNLGVDPTYDPLRGDPRFQDLLRRLRLPNRAPSQSLRASDSSPASGPRAPAPR